MRSVTICLSFFLATLAFSTPARADECQDLLVSERRIQRLGNDHLILVPGQKKEAPGIVQSRFFGPTQIKVWEHWQPSWNVENATQDFMFELIRGKKTDGKPYVLLRYKSNEQGLKARVRSQSVDRKEEWELKFVEHPPLETEGKLVDGWTEFEFDGADAFYDQSEVRAVTDIDFEILRGGEKIYSYELQPMYARGRNSAYWDNAIDPVTAHNGSGSIKVSTTFSAGLGWDRWNGVQIRPSMEYNERNTAGPNAEIGLHRHERNQEMWSVEEGDFVVINGIARRSSDNYRAQRVWDSKGTVKETSEFLASGGAIETRYLTPGDYFVIVPSADDGNTVYHHGIRSVDGGVFWTLGAKN